MSLPPLLFAVACAALLFPLSLSAAPLVLDLPLQPGGRGVWREGDAFRSAASIPEIDSTTGGRLSSGQAEAFAFHPETGLIPATADGHLLRERTSGPLQRADWLFGVAADGKYDLWVKVKAPKGVRRALFWSLLKPEMKAWSQTAAVIPAAETVEWRWFQLARGIACEARKEYRLGLREPVGGVELEGLVIVPAGAKPESAPPADAQRKLSFAQIETRPIALPSAESLCAIRLEPPLAEGAASFFYSSDGGKTWLPAPEGNLNGLETGSAPAFRVRYPFNVSGEEPFRRIQLEATEKAETILRSEAVELHFDPASGGLLRLRDRTADRDFLWPDAAIIPAALDLKQPGEASWRRFSPEGVQRVSLKDDDRLEAMAEQHAEALGANSQDEVSKVEGGTWELKSFRMEPKGAVAEYLVAGNVQLRLSYLLEGEREVRFRAEVLNQSPTHDVIRLEFPRLPRIRLGLNGWDDDQMRMQNFGHLRRAPGIESLREVKYPGALAMPWEVVSDAEGGLGIISIDPLFRNSAFASKPSVPFGDFYDFTLRTLDTIPAKGGKAARDVLLRVIPDRWHSVADRYRQWANKVQQKPAYPEWLQTSDGFLNIQLQLSCKHFSQLPQFAKTARRLNLDYIQFWGQMAGPGGGCCAPYVEPSPVQGGRPALAGALEQLAGAGFRTGFYFLPDRIDRYHTASLAMNGVSYREEYPNGTLFPDAEWMERVRWVGNPSGKALSLKLTDAEKITLREAVEDFRKDPSKHRPLRDWVPVDLSDPEWQSWTACWAVDEYAKKIGANALYLDVMGTGAVRESFDLRKGDHGKGRYGLGRADTVAAILKRARQEEVHDLALLVEGTMDLSGQYAALMASGLFRNRALHEDANATEMMRYTFPERIVFEGHSNQGNFAKMLRLEGAFLNGNRLDMVYANPVPAGVIAGRKAIKPWLYRANFRHTLGLSAPVPARLFTLSSDEEAATLITLINREGIEGEVRLAAGIVRPGSRAFLIDGEGRLKPQRYETDPDHIKLALPESYFATLIFLSGKQRPEERIITSISREPTEGRIDALLHLANPGEEAQEVTLRAPKISPAWEEKRVIAAGEVVALPIPIQNGPYGDPEGIVEVDWKGGGKTLSHTLLPLSDWNARPENILNIDGVPTLSLPPNPAMGIQRTILHLPPGDYQLELEYFKTAGKSENSSGLVLSELADGSQHRTPLRFVEEEKWAKASTKIVVPRGTFETALFLYNSRSEKTLSLRHLTLRPLP